MARGGGESPLGPVAARTTFPMMHRGGVGGLPSTLRPTSPMRPRAAAGRVSGAALRALPAGSGSPRRVRGDAGRRRAAVTEAAEGRRRGCLRRGWGAERRRQRGLVGGGGERAGPAAAPCPPATAAPPPPASWAPRCLPRGEVTAVLPSPSPGPTLLPGGAGLGPPSRGPSAAAPSAPCRLPEGKTPFPSAAAELSVLRAPPARRCRGFSRAGPAGAPPERCHGEQRRSGGAPWGRGTSPPAARRQPACLGSSVLRRCDKGFG